MRMVELHFDYEFPKKAVYDWWTDLSGRGYIGRALKSLKPIGREGEKILVETRWSMMGLPIALCERLSLLKKDHWIWEPEIFGIHITDDFTLHELGNHVNRLRIRSEFKPKGLKGWIANIAIGWALKRMMVKEWKAADAAFRWETSRFPPS